MEDVERDIIPSDNSPKITCPELADSSMKIDVPQKPPRKPSISVETTEYDIAYDKVYDIADSKVSESSSNCVDESENHCELSLQPSECQPDFGLLRKNARSKFAQQSYFFVPFSIFTFSLSFVEPILVAFPSDGDAFSLQIAVLALSTAGVVIGIYLVGLQLDVEEYISYPLPAYIGLGLDRTAQCFHCDRITLERLWKMAVILIDGDVLFEAGSLLFGWCTIFSWAGFSALRCFRVFRISWYQQIHTVNLIPYQGLHLREYLKHGFMNSRDWTSGEEESTTVSNVAKRLLLPIVDIILPLWRILQAEAGRISFFLVNIEAEMFWKNSKGSLVILAAYFYTAYIVSVVFWNKLGGMETPEGQTCDTLTHCYITLIRLSMYDGTGFDFLQTTMNNGHEGLVFLLFLYLVVTAIILLNGLIGIFADAFSTDLEDTEEKILAELDSVLVLAGITAPVVAEDNPISGGYSSPRAFRMASPRAFPGGSLRGFSRHNVGSSVPDCSSSQQLSGRMLAYAQLSRQSSNRSLAGKGQAEHSRFLRIHSACQYKFSKRSYFWPFFVSATGVACVEPILVGFRPVGSVHSWQIAMLALSTALFILSIVFAALEYDGAVQLLESNLRAIEKSSSVKQLSVQERASQKILQKVIDRHEQKIQKHGSVVRRHFGKLKCMFSGEVVFELVVLIFGWATIIQDPGISALRCFRAVRMMWYVHLFNPVEDKKAVGFAYARNQFELYASSTVKLCVHYLEKLATDVPGKGALAVLGMFFYVTYVIMVVFWNQENTLQDPEGIECQNPFDCYITMMHLCFYDGSGFDFLTATVDSNHPLLSTLLILYMCFSSMILLNGLIGIFGATFSTGVELDSEDADYIDVMDDATELSMLHYTKQYRKELEKYLHELSHATDEIALQKLRELRERERMKGP